MKRGMRIGVVSDPHGCLVGLQAALEWLDGQGVDLVVCAGDVADFGPQPNECVALLAGRGIQAAQGNADRALLGLSPAPAPATRRLVEIAAIGRWTVAHLTPASRRWLATLPPQVAPAPGVLVVHGAPGNPEAIVTEGCRPPIPAGVALVAAGHLHRPFILRTPEGVWVNAGSAGHPCDGDPRAAVAILEQGAHGWAASVHRLAFDLDAAARAIRAAGMPYAERLVETLLKACWWE